MNELPTFWASPERIFLMALLRAEFTILVLEIELHDDDER
jgi:hypothetical protein